MALADQYARNDAPADVSAIVERAGLPRERAAAWLGCDEALGADFQRDSEKLSARWRIGAELLAHLPPKPARSEAQAAGAAAIIERDRAARAAFLDVHTDALYRKL